MSDPSDARGHDPLDELASAYVDGEATPEEAARVEADPALRARVAGLRAVAAAVAAPVDRPPDEVRDAHLAAALAAADEPGDAGSGAPAPAVDLAAERAVRERHRRWLWAISVAAAVLAAVLAVPLLSRLGGDAEVATVQEQEDSAAEESAGPPTTPADQDAAAGAGGEGLEADLAPPVVALGSFADQDELLRAVGAAQRSAPTASPSAESTLPQSAAGVRCPSPRPPSDEITGVYQATVAGAPVWVYVYADRSTESVLVLDAACDPLLETNL